MKMDRTLGGMCNWINFGLKRKFLSLEFFITFVWEWVKRFNQMVDKGEISVLNSLVEYRNRRS